MVDAVDVTFKLVRDAITSKPIIKYPKVMIDMKINFKKSPDYVCEKAKNTTVSLAPLCCRQHLSGKMHLHVRAIRGE